MTSRGENDTGEVAGSAQRSSDDTGARLGAGLLAYMLAVTLIITLLPFQFDWPTRWRVMFTGGVVDIVANVLLFFPLGFLLQLARREGHRHSALAVLWLGALTSMAIESAQLFERERYASVLDVSTNAAGAWLGAWAFARLTARTRMDGAFVGRLSLELPLMGLVYLLVPLLWLNALASGGTLERGVLAVLLGVFGASLLGGIQRHHFGPNRGFAARGTAAGAVAWFLAGSFPALPVRPAVVALASALVGGLAWLQGSRSRGVTAANRRYEVPLLLSAAPAFATYLLLLTAAPLLEGIAGWRVGVGFPGVASTWTKLQILRLLELVAAHTLLGYMVAEFRGRLLTRYWSALPRLAAWGTLAALLGEGVRGFHGGHGASVARGLVLLAALLYGGWLYYLQRAHVLRLIEEETQRRATPDELPSAA